MSLGAAILQPQLLIREPPDPVLALAEDLARLVALIAEDAAAGGPVTRTAEAAVTATGTTLAVSIQPRRAAAEARLRARFPVVLGFFDGLKADAEAAIDDPERILALVRKILGLARGAARATTLPVLRRELEFLRALVEDDLGLTPAMLGDTIAAFLAEWRARLDAAVEPADAAGRRRLRLARALLGRLQLRAALLRPPAIDMEPLARLLFDLLTRGGIAAALREVDCALKGIEASLDAALAAGRAVAVTTEERGAVKLKNAAEYSYYASWLLSDENLPLIGLSDLKDAPGFVTQLRNGAKSVERYFREEVFTEAEREALYDAAGPEPERAALLPILAAVNRGMQAREILAFSIEDTFRSEYGMPDELLKLRDSFAKDQELFLFNRRLLEHVFAGKLETFSDGFGNWLWWDVINPGLVAYPRNQVFVTGDRRLVMCDDIPLFSGTDLRWFDAPMFTGTPIENGWWFNYERASPEFCEVWAQVWTICGECAKAIWHLVKVQPGHEAQAATVGTIELIETIQQILFGKPLSAYFLERGPGLRRWGKTLDSSVGPRGIAAFFSSFQGIQTEALNEKFKFWLTVFLGDLIRTSGPIKVVNNVRDIFIGFVALLTFRGPEDGPSTLPRNPARNRLKQGAWVSLSDSLYAMLLTSLYPRDSYSIFIWTGDASGRHAEAMAGHWLGGSAGLGLAAGLSGALVAQINAWAEDVPRFFKTGGISAAKMFLLYWFYNYGFKENATDEGRYRPGGGGSFRGYPDKGRAASPYLLPFRGGTAEYMGQGNLGLFSHNFIRNNADGAVLQAYAYDFGHDFRTPIACSRAGVVWSFTENLADSSTGNWNVLTIRHATIDPVHDDFGTGPVQTYSVYGHLAQNGVRNAPLFGGTPPGQELLGAGTGTAVAQGDLIALAGDTGMSFHNHLHMHVVPDVGGQPGTAFAIPFVFQDAPGDGVLKSTTWYRSGNR
ncbi:hypothetical protein GI374_12105 [Paracoccus sp. S-4012]|uniref:M23 family metallopeptidase n=1 Tax=Paracoccus sp. S-4012 TaxID=2665648 RepID=UPI0012B0FB69|nr:M23 family metallopeptidase [Paracoccus sp. S-4012]MRX51178.1 hypothetical protein [Paracoccus sp. S-4012]